MNEEIQNCINSIKLSEKLIAEKQQLISELLKELDSQLLSFETDIKEKKSLLFVNHVQAKNYYALRANINDLEEAMKVVKDCFYESKIKVLNEEINQLKQVAYRDRMKLNKMLQQHVKTLVSDYFSPRVVLY